MKDEKNTESDGVERGFSPESNMKEDPLKASGKLVDELILGSGPTVSEGHSISLRDWFALASLAGMRAAMNPTEGEEVVPSEVAKWAYQDADAMMDEREKGS